jgi:hypothetical protein
MATGRKWDDLESGSDTRKPLPWVATGCRKRHMVRRGSTVRVRQRALQKPRKSGLFLSSQLAESPACGRYGALYGAFRFENQSASRRSGRGCGRSPRIPASPAVHGEHDGAPCIHPTRDERKRSALDPTPDHEDSGPRPSALRSWETCTWSAVGASRSRSIAVGPAACSQRASDKMRLVW